jgi:lysophospholipase L1-like esterase
LFYEAGAKLIAMEIAPSTVTKAYVTRIKEANAGIREVARKRDAPVVPIYAALQDASGMGLDPAFDIGDGVHFNVAGYKRIGETIFSSCLERILNE